MAKKNNVDASAERALAVLAPMLDRVIQAESGRVLAELEEAIAGRVREQMWAALQERLGRSLPNRVAPAPAKRVVGRPARKAAAAPEKAPGDKVCQVRGCTREYRSVGYCSSHYQSARKYGWPTPCPADFDPPARRRGRPPMSATASVAGAEERNDEASE